MRVHVLTPGFTTPNGRAFLFPLKVWKCGLRAAGFDLLFFADETPRLTDCDVLIVDSKFHKDAWQTSRQALLDRFSSWAVATRVLYFDTSDSAGWLLGDLLPIVHGYRKAQLLRDRTAYLRPLYGFRAFTDYYYRRHQVEDANPELQAPLANPGLLERLGVSWNSGLADYSSRGPLRMALRQRVPIDYLLRFPEVIALPKDDRPNAVSCRFGVTYARASVAWQRLKIRERLGALIPTEKVSRRQYMRELATSRIVVSPFGLGEITLKDFEVFLTGGLLLKPDMSHMETWPDFFAGDRTMASFSWDLDDLETVIERWLADRQSAESVAGRGQRQYLSHTCGEEASSLFVQQFSRAVLPVRTVQ